MFEPFKITTDRSSGFGKFTFNPICAKIFKIVLTSCRSGKLRKVIDSELKRAAHKIGNAAFLAPVIVISPLSACPP